jgi:hypothetical protein
MDISRGLGIGIVLIIPSFVGAGAVWHIFHSWTGILLWLVIMVCMYAGILKKIRV